jgi:F0F1-type ATP synthase assembly protein I
MQELQSLSAHHMMIHSGMLLFYIIIALLVGAIAGSYMVAKHAYNMYRAQFEHAKRQFTTIVTRAHVDVLEARHEALSAQLKLREYKKAHPDVQSNNNPTVQ